LEFKIKHITRKDLDVAKYDACIAQAVNSRIYAYSWYLDIVADHWDVLVYGDYEAVMPLPWRRKYFLKYIYFPFWILELGIFNSYSDKEVDVLFYSYLNKKFRKIFLRMNIENHFDYEFRIFLKYNYFQFLDLKNNYENIINNYKKDRIKDLKKASKYYLYEKVNIDIDAFIQLFKNNVAKRIKNINDNDYVVLKEIITKCLSHNFGDLIHIYDHQNHLVASGFFIKYRNTISILVSSTDFKNRENGANTFLIDNAIKKYNKDYEYFYFGGSSIPSIASYFKSFGASELQYLHYSKPLTIFSRK